MPVAPESGGHEIDTPFLLKLYYRTGAFYRPDDFASSPSLPYIQVYTWPGCTLNELVLELAAAEPSPLPMPAIGTRVAFQLVCPDLRSISAVSNAQPRYAVKDLGSVVIGGGGPGTGDLEDEAMASGKEEKDASKTLSDARCIVGDYISCAILPPLANGSVAPAMSARKDLTSGPRMGRQGHRGGFSGHENGHHRGMRDEWKDGVNTGFPMGEWRRGERLPEGPSSRHRGRGRW